MPYLLYLFNAIKHSSFTLSSLESSGLQQELYTAMSFSLP